MRRLVAGAIVVALAGCGRKSSSGADRSRDAGAIDAAGPPATTAILDAVQVELHGRAEKVIDPRALGRSLARCLIESGAPVSALAEQAPPGEVVRHLALTVDVAVHEPEAGRAELGATIDAVGRWRDDPVATAPAASLTGTATPRADAPRDVDPGDAAVAAVVLDLEPRVCAELAARLQLWAATDLRPGLTGGDEAQVRWALALAASRPPPDDEVARVGLIGAIAPHLGGAPPVRDAAIGALIAIGDARAVAALTAITDVGDEDALVRIIDAVARLGGDDARDYLEVMTSHRDPRVARAAKAGLASLPAAAQARSP